GRGRAVHAARAGDDGGLAFGHLLADGLDLLLHELLGVEHRAPSGRATPRPPFQAWPAARVPASAGTRLKPGRSLPASWTSARASRGAPPPCSWGSASRKASSSKR